MFDHAEWDHNSSILCKIETITMNDPNKSRKASHGICTLNLAEVFPHIIAQWRAKELIVTMHKYRKASDKCPILN